MLARGASALPSALHSDLRLLAQLGRAVLRRNHRKTPPPWRLRQRRRAGDRDHGLPRTAQRQTEAVRLVRFSALHPRKSGPRETTLESLHWAAQMTRKTSTDSGSIGTASPSISIEGGCFWLCFQRLCISGAV